jgi:hypothetical protein
MPAPGRNSGRREGAPSVDFPNAEENHSTILAYQRGCDSAIRVRGCHARIERIKMWRPRSAIPEKSEAATKVTTARCTRSGSAGSHSVACRLNASSATRLGRRLRNADGSRPHPRPQRSYSVVNSIRRPPIQSAISPLSCWFLETRTRRRTSGRSGGRGQYLSRTLQVDVADRQTERDEASL